MQSLPNSPISSLSIHNGQYADLLTAQNAKEDAMAHGMHRERHGNVPMGQPIPMGMNRGRGMGMF